MAADKPYFAGAAGLLFVVMGLVQFDATFDGLEYWLGWHWLIAGPLAFILAYVPIVGSVTGVVGAHVVWGWKILPSLLLFFWYVPLYGAFCVASFMASASRRRKPAPQAHAEDIAAVGNNVGAPIQRKRNVVTRAVRGELSLPVTFWVFGVLALLVVNVLVNIGFSPATLSFWISFIQKSGLNAFQAVVLSAGVLLIGYKAAIICGIWVSAGRYAGPGVWVAAAKGFMVLWTVSLLPDIIGMAQVFTMENTSTVSAPLGRIDSYGEMVRQLLH